MILEFIITIFVCYCLFMIFWLMTSGRYLKHHTVIDRYYQIGKPRITKLDYNQQKLDPAKREEKIEYQIYYPVNGHPLDPKTEWATDGVWVDELDRPVYCTSNRILESHKQRHPAKYARMNNEKKNYNILILFTFPAILFFTFTIVILSYFI